MKKRLVLLIAVLISALIMSACSGTIEYAVIYDSDGGCTTAVEINIDTEYFGAEGLDDLRGYIEVVSDFFFPGFEREVDESKPGVLSYIFVNYMSAEQLAELGGDEEEQVPGKSFFWTVYRNEGESPLAPVADIIEGKTDIETWWAELIANGYYENGSTFASIFDIVDAVKREDAGEVKLYFTLGGNFTGFFADGYYYRQNFVDFYTWDLTDDPRAPIVYGQKLPRMANWYLLLLLAAGAFVGLSYLGIYLKKRNGTAVCNVSALADGGNADGGDRNDNNNNGDNGDLNF